MLLRDTVDLVSKGVRGEWGGHFENFNINSIRLVKKSEYI